MTKTPLAVLLFLVVLPLQAQDAARFLVEKIEVRDLVHASSNVVLSESRLHAGTAYTETELRDANRRVKRLPFVLDATFSLEKGSVRDAYVLVISVNETRPLFYVLDTVLYRTDHTLESDSERDAVLGARMFVGSNGVFHVAAVSYAGVRPYERSYESQQAGYTQYGVFGQQSFATVTVNVNESGASGTGATVSPGAVIGVALSANQTLTVSYRELDAKRRGGGRSTDRIFETRVSYDTTNDPFFPTEGTLLSAGPVLARYDVAVSGADLQRTTTAGVDGHAAGYWPVGSRDSVSLAADGGILHESFSDAEGDSDRFVRYGSVMGKISHAIGAPSRDRDQRLELEVRTIRNLRVAPLPTSMSTRGNYLRASLAWVRRNAWGLLRFGVGYAR